MERMNKQGWTKLRPELRIPPVSSLEKRTPIFNRDRYGQSDLPKKATSAIGWNLLQLRGECL